MFAWILNTNPVNLSDSGSTSPSEDIFMPGLGASCKNSSRKGWTPKLVMALPKNIGVSSPSIFFLCQKDLRPYQEALYLHRAFCGNDLREGLQISCHQRCLNWGDNGLAVIAASNNSIWESFLLYTPLKSRRFLSANSWIGADPEDILQLFHEFKGVLAGSVHFVYKVNMGIPLILQTWKSLIVCSSTPLHRRLTWPRCRQP